MDIFTADTTSLELIRYVRRNPNLEFNQCNLRRPHSLNGSRVTLQALGIPALCNLFGISEDNRICLAVPSQSARKRVKGIRFCLRGAYRTAHPYLEIISTDYQLRSTLLPDDGKLYVESPAMVALGTAARLTALERKGKICHQKALLRLVKLCLEFCGTFSLDPFNPTVGKVVYNIDPVMTKDDLIDCVSRAWGVPGLSLAREAIDLLFDRSGSPQESFMGVGLFGASSVGGLQLCDYEANEPLDLSPAERQSIECRRITPDFQIRAYAIAIEYNGSVHEEGDNPERDRIRMLDYQTLGWTAFFFLYRDVSTLARFNASAKRVASAIAQHEGRKVIRTLEHRLEDREFAERQRIMFEEMGPWAR